MATPKQVRAWLEQAEADLLASRAEGDEIKDCHRRFWIQQSYEKSIKAYALMRWQGTAEEDAEFARMFLFQHSPLMLVSTTNTPLSKALHLLARDVDSFVSNLDNSELLVKIDATRPRQDPTEISYRYPFLKDGGYVAPCAYDGWDGYQGNALGARAAVTRLLGAVRDEFRIFARTPK
jgi:hypothetical protein